jgi:hypothetical protein
LFVRPVVVPFHTPKSTIAKARYLPCVVWEFPSGRPRNPDAIEDDWSELRRGRPVPVEALRVLKPSRDCPRAACEQPPRSGFWT